MKIIERNILPFQEDDFFIPVRDKITYIRILLNSINMLLLNNLDVDTTKSTSKFKLCIDKMSRLFFYKESKYFSIAFPLTVICEDDNIIEITTYSGKTIDFINISAVLSILNNKYYKNNPSILDYSIEPFDIEMAGIYLLEEFMHFEPSYIRFDIDPDNENGKLHPLHHLDLNFSQYGTFKLGLSKNITTDYFENIQNIKTDCVFIID